MTRQAAFVCVLLVSAGAVLWMVGPYLMALFLGGTLAMLAYRPYQWLRARGWSDRPAAASIAALFLLLVAAPLAGFATIAVRQGVEVGREMAELKGFSPRAMGAAISRWEPVRAVVGDPHEMLKSSIQSAGQLMTSVVLKLGKSVPEFLLQLILALVAFYFFLVDGERFVEGLWRLVAVERGVRKRLAAAFQESAASAVLAGLAAAVIQSVLIMAGYLILQVPGAFLAGALTFIFAWIPVLGSAPASLAGLLYLYAQGSTVKMAVMLALALTASVSDNLVRALVLQGRAGMHPLAGFVSVIGGIRMFGILGVVIGPIMAAMLLSLLRVRLLIADRQKGDHSFMTRRPYEWDSGKSSNHGSGRQQTMQRGARRSAALKRRSGRGGRELSGRDLQGRKDLPESARAQARVRGPGQRGVEGSAVGAGAGVFEGLSPAASLPSPAVRSGERTSGRGSWEKDRDRAP
jgi:predicted PurR-regulated permease PerM